MAAPASEPAMAPHDHTPWKADMMGRPYARSTCTAWVFMATSSAPLAHPKAANAMANCQALPARPGPTASRHTPAAAAATTGRLPNRSDIGPDSCMPANPAGPRTSNTRPSVGLSMPAWPEIAGMCTTHMASTNPFSPKTANTAARARVIRGRVAPTDLPA